MANSISSNPYVLDTASAVVPITQKEIRIAGITWMGTDAGSLADTNDMKLTDYAGHVIMEKRARSSADTLNIVFYNPIECIGLFLTEMDAGVLYIYLAD